MLPVLPERQMGPSAGRPTIRAATLGCGQPERRQGSGGGLSWKETSADERHSSLEGRSTIEEDLDATKHRMDELAARTVGQAPRLRAR